MRDHKRTYPHEQRIKQDEKLPSQLRFGSFLCYMAVIMRLATLRRHPVVEAAISAPVSEELGVILGHKKPPQSSGRSLKGGGFPDSLLLYDVKSLQSDVSVGTTIGRPRMTGVESGGNLR